MARHDRVRDGGARHRAGAHRRGRRSGGGLAVMPRHPITRGPMALSTSVASARHHTLIGSPALRVLAGQSRDDVRDSAELFRVALDELGIDLPDADGAQWHLARRTAGDIVAGRIGPAHGATELWLA